MGLGAAFSGEEWLQHRATLTHAGSNGNRVGDRDYGDQRTRPQNSLSRLPHRRDMHAVPDPGLRQIMSRLHPQHGIGPHAEGLLEPDRHLGGKRGAAIEQRAQRLPRHPEMRG